MHMNANGQRLNRSTFLLAVLVSLLLSFVFSRYVGVVGGLLSVLVSLWIIYLITLRLQDVGLSKWLAILVVLVLPLGLLFCALMPGINGSSTYGHKPMHNFDLGVFPGIKNKDA